MKRFLRAGFVTTLALVLTVTAAFAGNVHLTGGTQWSLSSLKVTGTVVGLNGIKSGYIRFVGYGYCYSAGGAYWTPTDPNQMDDDPVKTDNYPETRQNFANPGNKLAFTLVLKNPVAGDFATSQPYSPCAPGTWVWKGASLQVWENVGAAPGRLWDQQNYTCFPKQNGDFECR